MQGNNTNERPATSLTCTNKPPATRGMEARASGQPSRGHRQVTHQPGGGRSLEHKSSCSFYKAAQLSKCLGVGSTRNAWSGARRHQSWPASCNDIQFPRNAAELQHFLPKWGRENKQAPRPFPQWSSESCSELCSWKYWQPLQMSKSWKGSRKKKSQQSYLQLSAQSCTTRPAKHKTCIKNILPTVDQNYRFLCLQQHRW